LLLRGWLFDDLAAELGEMSLNHFSLDFGGFFVTDFGSKVLI